MWTTRATRDDAGTGFAMVKQYRHTGYLMPYGICHDERGGATHQIGQGEPNREWRQWLRDAINSEFYRCWFGLGSDAVANPQYAGTHYHRTY
jgi:hypothetical protein